MQAPEGPQPSTCPQGQAAPMGTWPLAFTSLHAPRTPLGTESRTERKEAGRRSLGWMRGDGGYQQAVPCAAVLVC